MKKKSKLLKALSLLVSLMLLTAVISCGEDNPVDPDGTSSSSDDSSSSSDDSSSDSNNDTDSDNDHQSVNHMTLANLAGTYEGYSGGIYETSEYGKIVLQSNGTVLVYEEADDTEAKYTNSVILSGKRLELSESNQYKEYYSEVVAYQVIYDHSSGKALLGSIVEAYGVIKYQDGSYPYKKVVSGSADYYAIDLLKNSQISGLRLTTEDGRDGNSIFLTYDTNTSGEFDETDFSMIFAAPGNTIYLKLADGNFSFANASDFDSGGEFTNNGQEMTIGGLYYSDAIDPQYDTNVYYLYLGGYDSDDTNDYVILEGDWQLDMPSEAELGTLVYDGSSTISFSVSWYFAPGVTASSISDYKLSRKCISNGATYTEISTPSTSATNLSDDTVETNKVYQYQLSGTIDGTGFSYETGTRSTLPGITVTESESGNKTTYSWTSLGLTGEGVKVVVSATGIPSETKYFTGTECSVGEDGSGADFEVGTASGASVDFTVNIRYYVEIGGVKYVSSSSDSKTYTLD